MRADALSCDPLSSFSHVRAGDDGGPRWPTQLMSNTTAHIYLKNTLLQTLHSSVISMALRSVISFVPRTVKSILSRLIGGLDIQGNGVDHPLLGLDPFVLCDAAPEIHGIGDAYIYVASCVSVAYTPSFNLLRKLTKGNPPFGFHPHYGLIAITYVLDGSFDDEDNLAVEGESPRRHINVKGSICETFTSYLSPTRPIV